MGACSDRGAIRMTHADERLAVLVHEVRSPVAALRAIAETFRGQRIEPAERRPLIGLAIAACLGIERLVRDVPVSSVRLEPVDIRCLVEEVVAAAVLGGANVRAEIGAGLPSLRADPVRLRQAFDNLVSNALRHAGSSSEVLVLARRDGPSVLISVVDRGPGIPVEQQERIFEPGVRLKTGRPGSGLGLAVSRAIAEAHGGTLTVESVPGQGSAFNLALPVS